MSTATSIVADLEVIDVNAHVTESADLWPFLQDRAAELYRIDIR